MEIVANEESELKRAFLAAAASAVPTEQWLDGPGGSLVYPEESRGLGRLTVSFTPNEMTLSFGPRGFHTHFALDEMGSCPDSSDDEVSHEGIPSRPARCLAAEAVAFIRELVGDELIIREGAWAVSCLSLPTARRPVFRVWRAMTPWVKERVWSGMVGGV